MNKIKEDPRAKLSYDLIKKGCELSKAYLISVEAGSSQRIVDIDYLMDLGLDRHIFMKCLACVQNFYLEEMNLKLKRKYF